MATTATIPVTITPEAAARVAALGMQVPFEQMLAQARQAVPGLRAIEVTLEDDPAYPGTDLRVVIWSYRDDYGPEYDPTEDQLARWEVTTFPPEVCEHFTMMVIQGVAPDAR